MAPGATFVECNSEYFNGVIIFIFYSVKHIKTNYIHPIFCQGLIIKKKNPDLIIISVQSLISFDLNGVQHNLLHQKKCKGKTALIAQDFHVSIAADIS